MRRFLSYTLAVCMLATLAGCGGSEGDEGEPAGNESASRRAGLGPDEVVFGFLEAVRVGDVDGANALLTPAALEMTAAHDLVVAPPGSPTASFEVAEVQYVVSEGVRGAHVRSLWSDVSPEGEQATEEVVWVLSEESTGWRIMGMAAQLEAGQEPVFMNFEDENHVRFMAGDTGTPEGGQGTAQPMAGGEAGFATGPQEMQAGATLPREANAEPYPQQSGYPPSVGQQPAPSRQAQQPDSRYGPGVR